MQVKAQPNMLHSFECKASAAAIFMPAAAHSLCEITHFIHFVISITSWLALFCAVSLPNHHSYPLIYTAGVWQIRAI